jgi:hypothetical protein
MKKPSQHLIAEVPRRQAKVEMTVGIDLAARQLIQSANRNPVESNEIKSNNKSKNPMQEKTKNKPLTPVTCS